MIENNHKSEDQGNNLTGKKRFKLAQSKKKELKKRYPDIIEPEPIPELTHSDLELIRKQEISTWCTK